MRFLSMSFACLLMATPIHAKCGGDFAGFVDGLKQ